MTRLEQQLEEVLVAYKKDLRRSSEWSDTYTEGGMHLSQEQALAQLLDIINEQRAKAIMKFLNKYEVKELKKGSR